MKSIFERKKITDVAIKFNGILYSLPAPNRHNDVISYIVETTDASFADVNNVDEEDKGFLDEGGTYLNRKQALISALEFDQVKDIENIRIGQLLSENLW